MSDDLKHMDRRLLLLGGVSLFALAGCGGILPTPSINQIYVLAPTAAPATPGPKAGWALAVELPDANDTLDSSRIAIMRTADTMDYFADAQWPDRLPTLVANALVQGFEASGRIDQVGRSDNALHANYVLQTDLRDFEARYDTPDGAPTILVRIAARLVVQRTRQVAASLVAEQSVPAGANTIDAAVQAFDGALGAVVAQIVNWALNSAPPI
ncbi:MAG TPA: ABC-type transport auxiliary lipoprotein family protein [Rhizomicrobium sp.]